MAKNRLLPCEKSEKPVPTRALSVGSIQLSGSAPSSLKAADGLKAKLSQLEGPSRSRASRAVRSAISALVEADGVWDRRMTEAEYDRIFSQIGESSSNGSHAENAFMHCLCSCEMYERGRSLLEYMRSRSRVTVLTLAYVAKLSSRELSKEREDLVYDCYDRVVQQVALEELDKLTASLLLEALARTGRWRICLSIVSSMTDSGKSDIPIDVCKQLVSSAVRSGCFDDACHLLTMLYGRTGNLPPFMACLGQVLQACERKPDRLSELLRALSRCDGGVLLPSSAEEDFAASCPSSWRVATSNIDTSSGKCPQCHQTLESANISNADVQRLRDTFVDASIIGGDVFMRSSPAEISSFRQHMAQGGPYDIVIDGLNVAAKRYSGRTSTDRIPPANGKEFPFHRTQLSAVLQHFYTKKNKILVVGKSPIASLLSDQWKRRVDYFVVNAMSQDDLFVVYAAFLSGSHCYVVSEDQYKDHKKFLPPDMQKLFLLWQGSRQITFLSLEDGKPVFKMPASYKGVVQHNATAWHLPLKDPQEAMLTYNVTSRWLCIQTGKNDMASVAV